MKYIVNLCRILVGALFIVSGLIKANDTIGFGYKLEEYFSPEVLHLPFLMPYATMLAALMCIAEIVLGVATLLGGKMKITSWALLLLIVFFTFLTFYSAYFNKVTDCGCFGDALKLTPWQSFTKDVVLLVLVLIIFPFRNRIAYNTPGEDKVILPLALVCVIGFSVGMISWHFPWIFTVIVLAACLFIKYVLMKNGPSEWAVAGFTMVISLAFCCYTYAYLPIKDFRPYRVGTNILKAMERPEGAPQDIYNTVLVYEKNGQAKEFTMQNYPWSDSTWKWKETKNVLIKKGYTPPIHDFSITDSAGTDHVQEFMNEKGYSFMLIDYDLKKTDMNIEPAVNAFANECSKANIHFYAITGSATDEIAEFKKKSQAPYTFYTADRTALKTIIRSNPGLLLIKNGTVMAMWHYHRLPALSEVKKQYGF